MLGLQLIVPNNKISIFFALKRSRTDYPSPMYTIILLTLLLFPLSWTGIQILVKCDKLKKFAVAYTEEDGSFETELPSNDQKSSNPLNCIAKIMGGPKQLYTTSKNYVAVVSKANEPNHFTTSKPLSFNKSCPLKGKCGVGASKTVDLPLPKEWGLAPSSYYIYPFIPIIGIP